VGTWLTILDDARGDRLRVAVKDAIDVRGVITTAGCRAVADAARPAPQDAACRAGIRAAGAVIVGKTNLDELCLSASGRNDWYGSPINPLAPDRVTGGSSSGSAVAVAAGEVDLALGTDTGGSVRIPAACCGIVGLKTTWGRIPLDGVWPLAPSLDALGPLAPDVAGVIRAMELIDPSWRGLPPPGRTIGRVRIPGVDPALERIVDDALDASGLEVRPVTLAGWADTAGIFNLILLAEFHRHHAGLLDLDGVSPFANSALRAGAAVTEPGLRDAFRRRQEWVDHLTGILAEVELLALPTLVGPPPALDEAKGFPLTELTAPFNVAGLPALSVPVAGGVGPVPAGLQLVGPPGGEELLCATAITAFGG
jgi:amidase